MRTRTLTLALIGMLLTAGPVAAWAECSEQSARGCCCPTGCPMPGSGELEGPKCCAQPATPSTPDGVKVDRPQSHGTECANDATAGTVRLASVRQAGPAPDNRSARSSPPDLFTLHLALLI